MKKALLVSALLLTGCRLATAQSNAGPWELTRNLVYNGSFEHYSNPRIPDFFHRRLPGPQRSRLPKLTFDDYGLTEKNAYHGKQCLRSSKSVYVEMVHSGLTRGETYTLSFYVRAGRDGAEVAAGAHDRGIKSTDYALTTEWTRYTKTFVSPGGRQTIWLRNDSDVPVWWDAVQIERGDKATEYVEARLPERALARRVGKQPGRPKIHARRVDSPPAIDGKLDDAVWKRVSPTVYDSPSAGKKAVHGFNIFLYFTYRPMSSNLLEMWSQINHEFAGIEEALTAECRPPVIVSPRRAPVHASLRVVVRQATLIAVNRSDAPCSAAFAWPDGLAPAAGSAVVFHEDRKVEITSAGIRDDFGPLERHIYRFDLK